MFYTLPKIALPMIPKALVVPDIAASRVSSPIDKNISHFKDSTITNKSSNHTNNEESDTSIEGEKKKNEHSENFSMLIQNFIKFAESKPSQSYSITSICEKIGFQRRRFYDVINVLEVAGCCKRINVDTITWFGRSNIRLTMQELVRISGASMNMSLSKILPSEKVISIAHLTQIYLLTFSALNKKQLDIRATAQYISRENGRFKTTLCKLYQITHILCSADILIKSDVPSIVSIHDEYFVSCVPNAQKQESSKRIPETLKIENLLCTSPISMEQSPPSPEDLFEDRMKDFIYLRGNTNQPKPVNGFGICHYNGVSFGRSYLPLPMISPINC